MPAQRRRKLLSHRPTLISLLVFGALAGVSLAALPLSLRWYNVQSLDAAVRHPPTLRPAVPIETFATARRPTPRVEQTAVEPASPTHLEESPVNRWVQLAHGTTSWLGHDDLGRSLLFRMLPAFLISVGLGLAAAAVATVVGTFWGTVAALTGGRLDMLMMRIVDVLYGLPYILMVILLKVGLTPPLTALMGGQSALADLVILLLAISGVSWLTMARVVRGQVLSLRAQPFVEAARSFGAGPWFIFRRHLWPNLIGPVGTYALLVVPQAILQESFLSFLGIGIQQPTPSLGRLAADGIEAMNVFVNHWWLIVFPCGLLLVTLLALNFIGDGLRDAFDPRSTAEMMV